MTSAAYAIGVVIAVLLSAAIVFLGLIFDELRAIRRAVQEVERALRDKADR